MNTIATYLVAAMLSWSPVKDHALRGETEAETIARYDSTAADIAEVVLDDAEPSLFPNEPTKAETALLLGSLSFWEGRYWRHVDAGDCNRREWRLEHQRPLECDGGQAFSIWQLHDGFATKHGWTHGIALDGGGWRYDEAGYRGKDLVADRKLAARMALHFARKSMSKGGSLCGYTGESALSGCPKAKQRLETATRYFREHPFGAPSSGV